MPPILRAAPIATARAQVTTRTPLRYAGGARVGLDLPAHVRAGSGLCWVGDRLAVVQDDVRCVALVDPITGAAEPVPLAAGEGGLRQFDEGRGNKSRKLDLEACFAYRERAAHVLVAFGSGSSPRRETIVTVTLGDDGHRAVREIHAPRFYASLRACVEFSGSELNIEGVAVGRDTLRLFQRGNGAPSPDRVAVNATADIPLAAFLASLEAGDPAPVVPDAVRQYDLGAIDGALLTFTDATRDGDDIVFLATAEASPDAVRDGPVTGVAMGWIGSDGAASLTPVLDPDGRPFVDKAEGIALDPSTPGRAYIVLDRDDAALPCELCVLTFSR